MKIKCNIYFVLPLHFTLASGTWLKVGGGIVADGAGIYGSLTKGQAFTFGQERAGFDGKITSSPFVINNTWTFYSEGILTFNDKIGKLEGFNYSLEKVFNVSGIFGQFTGPNSLQDYLAAIEHWDKKIKKHLLPVQIEYQSKFKKEPSRAELINLARVTFPVFNHLVGI